MGIQEVTLMIWKSYRFKSQTGRLVDAELWRHYPRLIADVVYSFGNVRQNRWFLAFCINCCAGTQVRDSLSTIIPWLSAKVHSCTKRPLSIL